MSNKTRLQTNNINLQVLIDKANALPDAGGSGGGGGSVETCTVTIGVNAPNMTDFIVHYIDSNMQPNTVTLDAMSGGTFTAARGNIIAIKPWTSMTQTNGNVTECFATHGGGAYIINDSAVTIIYN